MTVRELYTLLSERFSPSLSEIWDNDVLMGCPDPEGAVSRVLFSLDVTDTVVERAIETGADVIISHHPLVFSKLSSLTTDTPVGRRLVRLTRAGISVFSFHTRFDRAEGGVNDVLARLFHLSDVVPLGEGEASLGRVGILPEVMTLEDFAESVKRALGTAFVQVWDASRPVSRIAVVGGEGKDLIDAARHAGADTYLSGRLGYHAMQDAPINLIEAGHYYTERPSLSALEEAVKTVLPTVKTEIYTPNPLDMY